jgi:hypothetical protein
MARSYPYGKVPSSKGTIVSERFERPMVDCGYCSAQMAARTSRAGVGTNGKTEGHKMRANAGRPHWNGSNSVEIRRGLDNVLNVNVDGIEKAAVLSRVKQGFAVVISITYTSIPSYLKTQVGDFGHSVMLFAHRVEGGRDYVGYFDPLYEQGSQATWARWTDIDQALWSGGHNTTTKKYVPPPPPVQPPPTTSAEEDIVTTPTVPKQVSVPKGANMYTYSDFRADPANIIDIDPPRKMPLAGYTKAGDLAVGFVPASGTPPTNLTVKYMKKGAAPIGNYPPPPAVPGEPTDAQKLAIRKVEYQRVTTGSIIQHPEPPK